MGMPSPNPLISGYGDQQKRLRVRDAAILLADGLTVSIADMPQQDRKN
jgi:hypothetical protein